ncbi:probable methyltransferase-like protein 24 [Liolophura sinensis]|uniref:probable methyltransferase-like protein 24 n=1 Tax=Liolophura sinensis TaxID=3198878 RepID=UPI003157FF2A
MKITAVICVTVVTLIGLLALLYHTPMNQTSSKSIFPQKPQPHGKCPSAEPGHIPSAEEMAPMSRDSLQDIFHNYGSNSEVVCQKMLRMGLVGDGGWEVCDDPHVRPPQNNCLVYSFGINNDFSFDDMVALHYGCEVHSFDPSMKMKTSRRNANVMFHHLGVSGMNGQIKGKWPVNTLSKIRQDLGHSQRRIDVLKMDIESSEWPTLKTALEEGAFENINQVLLEMHGVLKDSKSELLDRLNYLRALRLLGYRIFYAHKNSGCIPKKKNIASGLSPGSPIKVNCYEVHMIKIASCAK